MAMARRMLNVFLRPEHTNSISVYCARHFSMSRPCAKSPKKQKGKGMTKLQAAKLKAKIQRRRHPSYKQYDVREAEQFSLCDAMRWVHLPSQSTAADSTSYIRAYEVGRPPTVPKYECHVKLKTRRDGGVIRNQIRLPHSVKTNIKICVICPPDSLAAKQAREAGATLVGEDEVFELVKSGKIDFDRCLAHPDSIPKIGKAGLPRILGPRGLMPNVKLGTVVENPGGAVRTMLGGSMYRERQGVVRMAVGQLGFTPEQLRDNIRAFLDKMKKDATNLSDTITKQISEVVSKCARSVAYADRN